MVLRISYGYKHPCKRKQERERRWPAATGVNVNCYAQQVSARVRLTQHKS